MEFSFCESCDGMKKWVRGVYRFTMDDRWFYIGSSVNLKNRVGAWKFNLNNGSSTFKKNRSITHLLPSISKVHFEIIEYITDGSDPKLREDFWIKQNFDNPDCINLASNAFGNKGRKKPLGFVPKPKKKKGPPTPKKPVAQFDLKGNLIKIHESIAAATKYSGVKDDIIRKVFNGKSVSPTKFIFKGVNADGSYIEPKMMSIANPDTIALIVKNYTLLGPSKLSKMTGISIRYLSGIAFGRARKGFVTEGLPKPKELAKPKSVIQYDFNGAELNRYNSIGEAARATGIKTSKIQEVLHGRRKRVKDFMFDFAA